ncbi:hypothetical protein AHAS_Ahas14G0111200 [Arachis hypogaea]
MKQLLALKYTDETSMTDHLNNFQGIMNQLSSIGIKFDEEVQGLLLLVSLPDSWEILRMSLSNSAPDGVISMDLAKSSILNKDVRRKSQGTSTTHSDVLVSESRGRNKSRGPKSRDQSRSKSRGKLVHEITITLLQLRTTNQQVHWVVQVIPYVSKGRSHGDCRLEASYGYLVTLSQDINNSQI